MSRPGRLRFPCSIRSGCQVRQCRAFGIFGRKPIWPASLRRQGKEAGIDDVFCHLSMNWHRLFGLILTDFFTGSSYVVELEKDLALKKQLLDVVVLRRGQGGSASRLPDGLDNLS